jgi:hypothetical protein
MIFRVVRIRTPQSKNETDRGGWWQAAEFNFLLLATGLEPRVSSCQYELTPDVCVTTTQPTTFLPLSKVPGIVQFEIAQIPLPFNLNRDISRGTQRANAYQISQPI